MNEDIKKVALRIRELREIEGATTHEMAALFGIPHETYLEYESGTSDMPISFLSDAAAHFGIQVYELLSGKDAKLRIYQVVRSGKGLPIERSQQYDYQHLAYNFANNRVLPLLVTVAPQKDGEPPHTNIHKGQEFDFVLEGQILITIGGKEEILSAGDAVYYDSSYPHGMIAIGDTPAKLLTLVI